MAEDTPFDDEVTTAMTDEAPEVKVEEAPEATDGVEASTETFSPDVPATGMVALAKATGNMQGEDPAPAPALEPEPEPEPEVMDNGQFQAQLLERDKKIGEVKEVLAKLNESRRKFYAEWQPKVNASLSLHELNEIQRRITRTEGARRNRVIEGLDRLADTMNLRPRTKRDPMFPNQGAQK
jgi:hypothetical protein